MADAGPSSTSHDVGLTGWPGRRARLLDLLGREGSGALDDDELGRLLDRFVAREGKRRQEADAEADAVRITERDFSRVAHVADGQFGRVDLVRCGLDQRLYCLKTMDKAVLRRSRQHTYPVRERRIHTLATLAGFPAAERPVPPLLCAFTSPTALHLVTSFHPSGSLWDILSLHPDGRLPEPEARHWAAGMIDAIGWLHGQGWAHRDVKPHNFLIDASPSGPARILLTDFGTASEEGRKGSGRLKRDDCLWPVGTPDYIAPDVLEAHEDALVRAEEEAEQCEAGLDPVASMAPSTEGYGLEIDWWSLGVVLFELVYGEAPFFAKKIGDTYFRIINFESTLSFPDSVPSSDLFRDFIRGLLSHASIRLGKRGVVSVRSHPWLEGYHEAIASEDLFLPPAAALLEPDTSSVPHLSANDNSAFAFSDLFVSSPSISVISSRPSPRPTPAQDASRSAVSATGSRRCASALDRGKSLASWQGGVLDVFADLALSSPSAVLSGNDEKDDAEWDGFTWGPTLDAFDPAISIGLLPDDSIHRPLATSTSPPTVGLGITRSAQTPLRPTTLDSRDSYRTPLRPSPVLSGSTATGGLSTVRRSRSRPISEQRQLQEMVDCVGLSARRRVLESGRKPRLLVLKRFDSEASGQRTIIFDLPRVAAGLLQPDPFLHSASPAEPSPTPPSPPLPADWTGRLRVASGELAQIERKLDGVRQRVLGWAD